MRIAELFGRSGRRLWIVVLTAVLAMSVTLVYTSRLPVRFVAASSLTAVLPVDTAPTGQVVNQSVENLRSAILSRQLASSVADETGLPLGVVQGALSTRRLANGNVVEITAESENAQEAVALATSAARAGMRLQTVSEVGIAQQGVILARQLFDEAEAALGSLVTGLGIGDPDAELEGLTEVLHEAERTLVTATDTDIIDELNATVQTTRDSIETILPDVIRYRARVFERDAAFERLSEATSRQLEAEAIATVASAELVSPATVAVAQSRRQEAARALTAAAVFGAVLGIGILVLADLSRSRPAETTHTPESDEAITETQ